MSLDVAPDGRTLVLEILGDLYTLPVAGGTATRITSGMAFDSQPRFSPDGTSVVFVSDRDGNENLWIMGVDDGRWIAINSGLSLQDEVVLDGVYELKLASQQSGATQKGGHFHADGTFHGEDH